MASPKYEIQVLKNAGTDAEEIINRVDVFMPWQMAFAQARKELALEVNADGVRVLDDLNHEIYRQPERI